MRASIPARPPPVTHGTDPIHGPDPQARESRAMSAFDPTAKVTSQGTIIQVPSELEVKHFTPGQVVAGIYKIERLVGEGGMSMVLSALHLPTGRRVALKVLQADTAAEEGAIARFWREVRAAWDTRFHSTAQIILRAPVDQAGLFQKLFEHADKIAAQESPGEDDKTVIETSLRDMGAGASAR